MTQIVQGLNIKRQKGTLTKTDQTFVNKMRSIPISANETADVVSGAFVEIDTAVTTQNTIKLASSTTRKDNVFFVPRIGMADDIAGSSQGDATDINGRFIKTKNTINGYNTVYQFYGEAGDVIAKNALVMIDDTDDERATLIPFVEATGEDPTTYAIAKALEPATASGQIIEFQFI